MRGHGLIDALEEDEELDGTMALMQGSQDRAGLDVERRVQAGGAVALIVVGAAPG